MYIKKIVLKSRIERWYSFLCPMYWQKNFHVPPFCLGRLNHKCTMENDENDGSNDQNFPLKRLAEDPNAPAAKRIKMDTNPAWPDLQEFAIDEDEVSLNQIELCPLTPSQPCSSQQPLPDLQDFAWNHNVSLSEIEPQQFSKEMTEETFEARWKELNYGDQDKSFFQHLLLGKPQGDPPIPPEPIKYRKKIILNKHQIEEIFNNSNLSTEDKVFFLDQVYDQPDTEPQQQQMGYGESPEEEEAPTTTPAKTMSLEPAANPHDHLYELETDLEDDKYEIHSFQKTTGKVIQAFKLTPKTDELATDYHDAIYDAKALLKKMLEKVLSKRRILKFTIRAKSEFQKITPPTYDGQEPEELPEMVYYTTRLPVEILSDMDDLESKVDEMLSDVIIEIENVLKRGSDLVFKRVLYMVLHIHQYQPQRGGCHLQLPPKIAAKRACLQVKNEDEKCFLYAILVSIHNIPQEKAKYLSNVKRYLHTVKHEGMTYPVSTDVDITKFEVMNNNQIAVNVLSYAESPELAFFPVRLSKIENSQFTVNLLLVRQGKDFHYVLIKNLSRLLSKSNSKYNGSMHFCVCCMQGFKLKASFEKHKGYCQRLKPQAVKFPEKNSFVEFTQHEACFVEPFMIVADCETRNVLVRNPENQESPPFTGENKAYLWVETEADQAHGSQCQKCTDLSPCSKYKLRNEIKARLDVISYCYKIIPYYTQEEFELRTYTGPNARQHFIEQLRKDSVMLNKKIKQNLPCKLTPEQKLQYDAASECHICQKPFPQRGDTDFKARRKVLNHYHSTAK